MQTAGIQQFRVHLSCWVLSTKGCKRHSDLVRGRETEIWCSSATEDENKKLGVYSSISRSTGAATSPSKVWCAWHIARGRYKNMTKWLCSCHPGAGLNIWRANVVSFLGGWIQPSEKWHIQLHERPQFFGGYHVMWWSQHEFTGAASGTEEDTIKAMKMIDCVTLGRKCLLTRFPAFSEAVRETVISRLNVFISEYIILNWANAWNPHRAWHIQFISNINTTLCTYPR